MPRLGAHLSAAGGLWRAPEAAAALGCRALQIFLRAPGRWARAALPADGAERFRAAAAGASLDGVCFAHAPYLLNLASADHELRRHSLAVLIEELERAGELGLAGVVLHPGSAGASDRGEAEARCRDGIAEAVDTAGAAAAPLLLEGTAGMGGQLGITPVELARLSGSAAPGRVGLCLDTAHLWAAGYDLHGDGWERVLGEVAGHWPAGALRLFHLNDTAVECGSRRDRHAPPGDGRLGARFYRRLLADPRVTGLPCVLEIPPGDDNRLVRAALGRLRRWSTGGGMGTAARRLRRR
jgi:deoxyribonuclease-4